jgi:arginase family enzyme
VEYLSETGIDGSLERALAGVDAVYVALDLDVLDPSEVDVFMAETNGASPAEIEAVLRETGARAAIVGVGVTGFVASDRNAPIIARLLAAAGL